MTKRILIGIGSILALSSLWWILAYRDDANLAKARESEATAILALKDKQKAEESARLEREAHEQERKQWQEQQAALMRSVLARNDATDRRIAAVLSVKPAELVGREVREVFGKEPTPTEKGFSVTVQEMQEFVALKLDRDRLAENLKETDKQLDLERQATATLRADLDRALKGIEQANGVIGLQAKTIEAYKVAATKTRLRKVLEFGGRAGITIGLAYLGAKAGSQ